MSTLVNRKNLLLIFGCMTVGAVLALLASQRPLPEVSTDTLDISLPTVENNEATLKSNYALLRQQFPNSTVQTPKSTAQAQEGSAKRAAPLLFFGLIRQDGHAKALLGERAKNAPVQSYRPGDALPDGSILQEIGQDNILIKQTNGVTKRINLYLPKATPPPARPSSISSRNTRG